MTKAGMQIHPVRTEQDHRVAVARIEELISAAPGTAEGDELEVLATLVDAYEAKRHGIYAHPMPDETYVLLLDTPSPDEYCRLRRLAGMSPRSPESAALGLPNTFFAVIVRKQDQLIGMGRIVGDGGLTFQLVDIAVDPEHQGRGLGKAIVGRLVAHLQQVAPPTAHISLLADGPAKHLYAKFGFRDTAPESIGMDLPPR